MSTNDYLHLKLHNWRTEELIRQANRDALVAKRADRRLIRRALQKVGLLRAAPEQPSYAPFEVEQAS